MDSRCCGNNCMAKINLAEDFSDFLKLCLKHEVRFMVIGGYAVVHHSRPRYTGDLDLWVDSPRDNALRAAGVPHEVGFRGKDVTVEMFTNKKEIIRMGFEPMRLELFTSIPGVDFPDCYPRRVFVKRGRMQVPFIGLEDLKVNKRASGRLKDLQDLEELP